MKVSVIGTMRGRPEASMRGIDSLINQAADIDNVEFIFRFDDDDIDTLNIVKEHYVGMDLDIKFLEGVRHGYLHLNKYWDELGVESTGEYIMHWCDDWEMSPNNKSNWDSVIREFEGQFYILDFPEHVVPNPAQNRTSCLIFPRKLFELMGNRLSPNLIQDRWFNKLYTINDVWVVCDDVKHINRDCFAGRAPVDDTYREGRAHYNSVGLPPGHKKWGDGDALKLKKYLEENPNNKLVRETNKTWLYGHPDCLGR